MNDVEKNQAGDDGARLTDGREAWFARHFELGRAPEELRALQQRLVTGPARFAVTLRGLGDSELRARPDDAWSVLENLGHLGDLEPLWAGRVEDLLNGEEVLRPADLENRATHAADHNRADAQELVERFTELRLEWLTRLSGFDDELVRRTALHPRLKEPMSVVDLCFFVAEHDDHHLKTVRGLLERG